MSMVLPEEERRGGGRREEIFSPFFACPTDSLGVFGRCCGRGGKGKRGTASHLATERSARIVVRREGGGGEEGGGAKGKLSIPGLYRDDRALPLVRLGNARTR